ncbi:MAG: class I SAM-dependent methyltransferase [Halobacteriales archaeon]
MADGDLWFFDRVARLYRLVMPAADDASLRQGLAEATRPIDRVADIGGGTGRAIQTLDIERGYVIDASAGMLALVPGEYGAIRASATALPIIDDVVDAILIVDALHHIPDVEDVLAECRRVVAPGGVVVIRDFDPATIRGRALVAAEHAIGMGSRFFAVSDLADRIESAGLTTSIIERGFTYTVVGHKPRTT